MSQILSSQGKNAPSNPYPHYLVRLATSRFEILLHRCSGIDNLPTVPEGHKHRVTTPRTLGKSRGPPQSPAETPQNPRRDPAEPSERPPQSPLRGEFPRRASRRVVPLGWWPSGTLLWLHNSIIRTTFLRRRKVPKGQATQASKTPSRNKGCSSYTSRARKPWSAQCELKRCWIFEAEIGNVPARRRQLRASSGGSFPLHNTEAQQHLENLGGSFLLTARSFLLTVGLYYLRWSFLLTVEIRFGLVYLRLKFGLVLFAYGGKLAWSSLLTVPLVQKIGFGLFYLRFPHRK